MKTKLPFISIMLAISVVLFAWLLVSTIGSRTREGKTQKAAPTKTATDNANKALKNAVSKVAVAKSAVAAKIAVAAKSAVAARNPLKK